IRSATSRLSASCHGGAAMLVSFCDADAPQKGGGNTGASPVAGGVAPASISARIASPSATASAGGEGGFHAVDRSAPLTSTVAPSTMGIPQPGDEISTARCPTL